MNEAETRIDRVEPMTLTDAKRDAIRRVLAELDRYGGEVVEKDTHPLWRAVVDLEAMSVHKETHNRLNHPAAIFWFCGLWCSRGSQNVEPAECGSFEVYRKVGGKNEPPRPDLALVWFGYLKRTLEAFLGE